MEPVVDASFDLHFGEKRRRAGGGAFAQRLQQGVFDFAPVFFGEVGLELEQGGHVFDTAGGREGGIRI